MVHKISSAEFKKYLGPTLTAGIDRKQSIGTIAGKFVSNIGQIAKEKFYRIISLFTKGEWINNKTVMNKLDRNIKDLKASLKEASQELDIGLINRAVHEMRETCNLLRKSGANEESVIKIGADLAELEDLTEDIELDRERAQPKKTVKPSVQKPVGDERHERFARLGKQIQEKEVFQEKEKEVQQTAQKPPIQQKPAVEPERGSLKKLREERRSPGDLQQAQAQKEKPAETHRQQEAAAKPQAQAAKPVHVGPPLPPRPEDVVKPLSQIQEPVVVSQTVSTLQGPPVPAAPQGAGAPPRAPGVQPPPTTAQKPAVLRQEQPKTPAKAEPAAAKPEKRKVFGEKVRKGQKPAKFKPMEKPQALHEERPTVQGPGLAARKKIAAGKSEWRIKEDKENFVKVLEKIATMVSKDVREGRASAHKPLSPNLRNIQSSQKYSDINIEIDDAIGIIEDAYTKFMIPKGIREEIEKLRQKANEKVEAEKAEDDRIKIQEDKAKKELKNRQDFDAKFKHKKLERSTEEPGPAGRGEKYYRYADTSHDYRKAAEMYEGLETTDKEDAGLRAEAEKAKQKDLATRKKFDVEHPRKELRKTIDDRGIFRREKASVKGPKFKEYDEGIKRKGITKTQEKGLYQAKQKADAARYVDKLSEERRKSGKPIHQPAQPAKPKEEKPAVKTEFRKPDIAGQEKYQGNYVGKTQERVKEAERIKYSLPTGNVIELTPEDIARDEAVLREQRMAKGQMVDEPKFAPEESLRSKGKKTVEKATEEGPKASDDLRLKNRGARVPVEEQVSEEAQPVEAGHEGRFGEAIKQKEKKAESMNKESRIKRGEELQIEREKTVRKGAGEVGKVRVPEGIQKKEAERNIKILLRKMSDSPSVQKYLGAQYSIEKRFTKGRDLGKLDSFAKKDYTTMSKAEILRDLREIEALISKASVHKERQASETDFFNELTFKVNDIMSSLE